MNSYTDHVNIKNLTKDNSLEIIHEAIKEHWLFEDDLGPHREELETALRIVYAHLKQGETTPLGTAVDCIFEMYRRDDDVDKSYRNAARFILSAVNGVPARYEAYKNEDARSPLDIIDEGKKRFELQD